MSVLAIVRIANKGELEGNLEILALLGLSDKDAVRLASRYWMSETLALENYPTHGRNP